MVQRETNSLTNELLTPFKTQHLSNILYLVTPTLEMFLVPEKSSSHVPDPKSSDKMASLAPAGSLLKEFNLETQASVWNPGSELL